MMASVDPTTTTSRGTSSGKLLARSRLGDLFDILIAIAASPLVLCQTVIFPCFPRDRLLALLALALAAHFTIHRRAVHSSSGRQKLAAILSLILWSSVVLAGRAIADFDIRVA